ncbi:MAG: hypothetical protein KDD53_09630 [Bdellovibrionales bacterium]|nr:hypothetical protein [Bdellovibrionales bacterium]
MNGTKSFSNVFLVLIGCALVPFQSAFAGKCGCPIPEGSNIVTNSGQNKCSRQKEQADCSSSTCVYKTKQENGNYLYSTVFCDFEDVEATIGGVDSLDDIILQDLF